MSAKSTYWITGPEGDFAQVEGADQRDYWVKVRGWSEADEPGPLDQVHLANADDPELGPARLPYQAATDPAWAARGWKPGPPPEPVNLALPPEHPAWEAARKAAAKQPAAEEPKQTKSTRSATSGENKE